MTDKAPVKDDEEEKISEDESDLPPLDDQSPAQVASNDEAKSEGDLKVDETAPSPQAVPAPDQTDVPQATSAVLQPQMNAVSSPSASPTSLPEAGTVDVLGVRPPAQNALQGFAQNMAFQQDLAGGKITPETYSDLFEKKGTLGKIGTLFGLMLSGAGSGLAHQPNALLEMMNNEISRDLEAQKQNQSNKLSWYNSALAHETNQSNIALQAAHEQAVRTGTLNAALDAEMKNYINSVTPGLHRLVATTEAKNNMSSTSLQYMQDNVNRLAPGASKAAAQAFVDNTIRPAVNAQMLKNQQDIANQKDAIHQLYPNPLKKALTGAPGAQSLDPRGPVIDNDKYQQAIQLGRLAPNVPGAIRPEQVPLINAEASKVATNRNVYADWADTFQKLQNLKLAGQLPGAKAGSAMLGLVPFVGPGASHAGTELSQAFERQRNIEKEAFKQRVGTNLGAEEKEQLANSLLPAWNDTDKTSMEAWRKGVQHFKTLESGTQNLDQYGLKTPFPLLPFQPPKGKEAPVTFEQKYKNMAQ